MGKRSWPARHRHLTRAVLGTLAVLALLTGGLATPAGAVAVRTWTSSDGFEADPAGLWTFGGNPDCPYCGSISDDPWQAHSGTRWASIETKAANSWYSAARTVTLAPPTTSATCALQMFVKVPAGTVNVEVIDPTTWTYLALTTVGVSTDYRLVTTPAWRTAPRDVVVRASVVRTGSPPTTAFANIDDVTVRCTY